MLSYIVKQQFKGPDVFGAALSQPVGKTEAQARVLCLSYGERCVCVYTQWMKELLLSLLERRKRARCMRGRG